MTNPGQPEFIIDFKKAWRVTNIYRWHMCSKTREQTVAEHMANVQMICLELVKRLDWEPARIARMLYMALIHDMDEVILGDSTPIMKQYSKYDAPNITIEGWPRAIDVSSLATFIIDLADKIEALKFIREYGTGDYAREVAGPCLGAVREALGAIGENWPSEVHYIHMSVREILNSDEDPII